MRIERQTTERLGRGVAEPPRGPAVGELVQHEADEQERRDEQELDEEAVAAQGRRRSAAASSSSRVLTTPFSLRCSTLRSTCPISGEAVKPSARSSSPPMLEAHVPGHVEEAPEPRGDGAGPVEHHGGEHRFERLALGELVQFGLGRAAAHAVDEPPADDERPLEDRGVLTADAHALRPRGDLLGVEIAEHPHQAQAPARDLGLQAVRRALVVAAAHQVQRGLVGAQATVDGRREAELLHAVEREVHALLVEQCDKLVAQPGRREVADQVHGAAGARQVERVLVHAQPVAVLVADRRAARVSGPR